MPLSGKITPVGVVPGGTPTPAAARAAEPVTITTAPDKVFNPFAPTNPPATGDRAPAQGTPAAPAAGQAPAQGTPGAAPAKPEERYEAWRVEAIARREREATQARLAAKAERDALAKDREAMESRRTEVEGREKRLEEVDRRLSSYRYNPHLALQDLAQYGVTFEMLAQAVASGMASPDQIAAAEAAGARREVEDFRREQAERDRAAQDRAAQDQADREARRRAAAREGRARDAQAQTQAEADATAEWQGELRSIVAREPDAFPLVSARLDRGAMGAALDWAEGFLAKEGRVPANEEVLRGVEAQMEADAQELVAAAQRRRSGAPPAATLTNGMRPAPAGAAPAGPAPGTREYEAQRRARTLAEIDRAMGRGR